MTTTCLVFLNAQEFMLSKCSWEYSQHLSLYGAFKEHLWAFKALKFKLMFLRFIKHSNDVYINTNNNKSLFKIIIMKLLTKCAK